MKQISKKNNYLTHEKEINFMKFIYDEKYQIRSEFLSYKGVHNLLKFIEF